MPTRGRPPDAEAFRVQVVRLGIGPQPANRGLAILNLGRERGLPAVAMVDASDGVPLAEEGDGRAFLLAAEHPGTRMDPDDDRQRAVGFFRDKRSGFCRSRPPLDVFQIPMHLRTLLPGIFAVLNNCPVRGRSHPE